MNMQVQVQKINIGSESAVVVPATIWARIVSAMEDLEDIIAYDRAKKKDDGVRFSLEEVEKRLARKTKRNLQLQTN